MENYKLIMEKTGEEIKLGEEYKDFRGDTWTVYGWQEPKHAGSTGRVYVYKKGLGKIESAREFFPGVLNMKIVKIEEQTETKKQKYVVEITETLQRRVEVEASSKSEAISMVKEAYRNEDYVLDYEDYVETEFEIVK